MQTQSEQASHTSEQIESWCALIMEEKIEIFTLFWGVPVIDEPGSVNGGNYPAVSAKHVHKQQWAANA